MRPTHGFTPAHEGHAFDQIGVRQARASFALPGFVRFGVSGRLRNIARLRSLEHGCARGQEQP